MKLRQLFRAKPTSEATERCNERAGIALQSGELELAIQLYCEVLAARPDFAEGYYKRGNACNRLGRWREALADYDRAIDLDSAYAHAYCNRGTVLERLERRQEALASYDRALELNPGDAFAHYNRAGVLRELRRLPEALNAYDRAISLNQRYLEAYVNRGHLLQALSRHEDAVTSYRRALEICPIPAATGDGSPRTLRPEQKYLLGLKRQVQMQICDWSDLDADLLQIAEGLREQLPMTLPFPALAMSDDPALHRSAAATWIREEAPANAALGPLRLRPRAAKLRIGYFSADFRVHPVAFLTAGLFESHDRSRFEIIGFSLGRPTDDAMQQRLSRAFDRFVDVHARTDVEVAAMAREIGIDIAVNLNGITEDSRTGIFALRAAPIQISYLGYPGTMGSDYMDYLVADDLVIPTSSRSDYAEKIIHLPGSFMPFDTKYSIADREYARAELGLPEFGFIFCCFNNASKINPPMLDRWAGILSRSEGGVLWLSQGNAAASRNLRQEFARRGLDPRRLIFAERMQSLPDHLARLRVADLFLDTFPYNAHATALDALWAGVPVLTCSGRSFASRVAASLLHATAIPGLVTTSLDEYEELAVRIAADGDELRRIRETLAHERACTTLFDTGAYARKLEAAYSVVDERYRSGAAPEHVDIADIIDQHAIEARRCYRES